MTIEEHIFRIVEPLITVYPDKAPINAQLPYLTYQRFGGQSVTFVDKTLPDKKNAVIQINCWASSAIEASNLIMRVEKSLLADPTVTASAITEPVSTFDDDPESAITGRMQDFSIWYPTS